MSELDRIKRIATASNATTADAFDAGRDAGMDGTTISNSHFRFFASPERSAAWQRGYDGTKSASERSEANDAPLLNKVLA